MGEKQLTADQQSFLTECEEEFKQRFTEDDPDFMQIYGKAAEEAPVVMPWQNQHGGRHGGWQPRGGGGNRQFDRYHRRGHGGYHHRDGNRPRDDYHRREDHHWRDGNRDRDGNHHRDGNHNREGNSFRDGNFNRNNY